MKTLSYRNWWACENLGRRSPSQKSCLYDERGINRLADPPRCIKHGALLFYQAHLDGLVRAQARKRLDAEIER